MSTPVEGPRQFRLYVAGSRKATPTMLQKAYQAVERAKFQGWAVLVGDNPEGVDAAVIAACNALKVNYLCFGIAEKPRSTNFLNLQNGGTGRYIRVTTDKPYDYATRDRRVADLSDRGLFLWNGTSKGTFAAYEYMKSLDKPTDLLTFSRKPTPPAPPAPPSRNKLSMIELIIDTTAAQDKMAGTIGLRALDPNGTVLYQTREALPQLDVHSADYAKLHTLIHALNRLNTKITGETASYGLKITQSSKNVEGWLAHGWKRNMDTVKQLGSAADGLLKHFPTVEWVKVPRPQVVQTLNAIP